MDNDYDIANEDGLDFPLGDDEVASCIDAVLAHEGVGRPCMVSVSVVSDERIREVNAEWRGVDAPTDVVSLECERPDDPDLAPGEPCELGDIILAPAYIAAQAARFGTTVAELVRLNNIADPDRIYEGDRLIIRAGAGDGQQAFGKVHVVHGGAAHEHAGSLRDVVGELIVGSEQVGSLGGDVVQAVDVAHEAPFGVCGCGLRTKSSYIVGLHLGEVNDAAAAGRFRAGLAADCRTACDSVSGGSFEDDGLFTGGLRLGRACRGVP